VLKDTSVDWDPKPFRSLDVWQSDGRFNVFIHGKWLSYEVHGGGMFVLKEKLKMLKPNLKFWNREVFENVKQAGEELHKKN